MRNESLVLCKCSTDPSFLFLLLVLLQNIAYLTPSSPINSEMEWGWRSRKGERIPLIGWLVGATSNMRHIVC
ncbi:hypothetical protein QTP86_027596 [Hemibagrus guttatus]|nr:hypothetical protein QTP86_027596 [Hemibagrus guttatus]